MDRKRGAGVLVAIGTFTVIHACQIENVTPVVVSTVTVEPGEASVTEGNGLQFTATVLDELDQSLGGAVVEWTSDDGSVLAVEPDGSARALSPGSTVVYATYDGVTGSSEVTVLPSAACQGPVLDPGKGHGGKDPGGKDRHKGKKGHGHDDDDDGDDDGGGAGHDDGHDGHHHNGGGDDDNDDDGGGDGDQDGGDDPGDDGSDDQPDDPGDDPHCVAPDGHRAFLEPVAVVGDPR